MLHFHLLSAAAAGTSFFHKVPEPMKRNVSSSTPDHHIVKVDTWIYRFQIIKAEPEMYLKKYVIILRNLKNLLLQFFNLSWNTPET